jgi:hypothetical protein
MDWLEQVLDLRGFCAADKVVGKATAMLYCLLGAQAVYARVISTAGMAVLQRNGIAVFADQVVPFIINRLGTGQCPMEDAVASIDNPQEAPEAIRQRLIQLQKQS